MYALPGLQLQAATLALPPSAMTLLDRSKLQSYCSPFTDQSTSGYVSILGRYRSLQCRLPIDYNLLHCEDICDKVAISQN